MGSKLGWMLAFVVVVALSAAALVLRPFAEPATPALTAQAGGYALVVDRSERRLYVYENGQAVRSFPVAVGSREHPTPTGTFYIRHITWNPSWVPPDAKWARHKTRKGPGQLDNPMGNVKMFFLGGGYYIHGTREYDSLGEPDSHGCVRMANGEAIGLAEDLMAQGGKNVPPSWFDRVLDHVRNTREVYLSHPIPVTIR